MQNVHHAEILKSIKRLSGVPTRHTFQDNYLGTSLKRYPINNPTLRKIAKEWMTTHRSLTALELQTLITSIIQGKSSTEKSMAGILLDYATAEQRKFDPVIFEFWVDQLTGWAEVDSLCSGKYPHMK